MLESAIEGPVCHVAELAGWFVRKLQYPGRRGAPDRMFIKGGRVVFIEFKRPGKIPVGETLQSRERDRIVAHGGEAYFVDSIEEACRILGLTWPVTKRLAKPSPRGRLISGPSS